jgi:hypothetical protein
MRICLIPDPDLLGYVPLFLRDVVSFPEATIYYWALEGFNVEFRICLPVSVKLIYIPRSLNI